jgi:two-component system response regulator HydG
MSVYTFVTYVNGPQADSHILLEGEKDFRIGRGEDCDLMLSDPIASRVHAIIQRTADGWFLRDFQSRNGTFVNGQKIDEARLLDGTTIKIGAAEFVFRQTAERPNIASAGVTQTIIRNVQMQAGPDDSGSLIDNAFKEPDRVKDLLLLHQLSVRLLGCDDPDEVVQVSLDLLLERSQGSMVGFLWVNDEGHLKPKLVVPADAKGVALSEKLTGLVTNEGRAVWIDNQTAKDTSESLSHFADAICVPLIFAKHTLGAIHLYLERGRFRQSEFDFAISVANILVVALVRARQQASLRANHQRLVAKSAGFDELVGESKPMLDLKNKISRVAKASGCVLVRGESGAGKELVARAIHKLSPRADRPLLCVSCAAMPRDLMESQLFGHKKGAFTGADNDHMGWFKQADSGTLFLDEVGEMTLEGQAKLLRILEGHPFMPVGATKEVSVDVRVIAATNRDLRDFVRDGKFREDLYYRLSVFELYIPPLRERDGDIEMLINFFLDHFKRQHGRPGLRLGNGSREKLLGYQWPGNVRQLRNVIDSSVVMAMEDIIQPEDLGLRDASGSTELQTLKIDFWERKLIKEALGRTSGSVPEAAKLLGIGRATLYRKLDEYAIER